MKKELLIASTLAIADFLSKQTSNSLDDKAIQLIKDSLPQDYKVDIKELFIVGLKELAEYTDNTIDDYLVEKIELMLK